MQHLHLTIPVLILTPITNAHKWDIHQYAGTSATDGFIGETKVLERVPISRRTLLNLRNAGKIPYVKFSRRVLYHWPSVEAALLRQQRGGEK